MSDPSSLNVLLLFLMVKMKGAWMMYLVRCQTSGIVAALLISSLKCEICLVRSLVDSKAAQEYIKFYIDCM